MSTHLSASNSAWQSSDPGSFGVGTFRTKASSVLCALLVIDALRGPSLLPGEGVERCSLPATALSEPREDGGVLGSLRTFYLRCWLFRSVGS